MHYWPTVSILKSQHSLPAFRARRPKGLTDEEWNVLCAEEKMNKLITINKVPKASKKDKSSRE